MQGTFIMYTSYLRRYISTRSYGGTSQCCSLHVLAESLDQVCVRTST